MVIINAEQTTSENVPGIRAASSKFVSLSILSWQVLTAHAQPFREARDLAFCLKVPLDSLLVWSSSGGSGKTAWMRRLAWDFAAHKGDKYQIGLTRSIWYTFLLRTTWVSRRLEESNLTFSSQCSKFWSKFLTARLLCFSMNFISSAHLPSYFRGNPGNWRDRPTIVLKLALENELSWIIFKAKYYLANSKRWICRKMCSKHFGKRRPGPLGREVITEPGLDVVLWGES